MSGMKWIQMFERDVFRHYCNLNHLWIQASSIDQFYMNNQFYK